MGLPNDSIRGRVSSLADVAPGGILFACGFLLAAIGSLGRSMSRRGW